MALSKVTGAEHLTTEQLKDVISYLYSVLDDIDTTGDIVKEDDVAYRARVEKLHVRRGYVARSLDGQTIHINRVPASAGMEGAVAPEVSEADLEPVDYDEFEDDKSAMSVNSDQSDSKSVAMCMPRAKQIYYSLRITGVSRKEEKRIRALLTDVKEVLLLNSHRLFDPTAVDIGFMQPHAIVAHDCNVIDNCEILIIDLCNGIGPGSMMEMFYAKSVGKRVIAIVGDGKFPSMSSWIKAHTDVAVNKSELHTLLYVVNTLGTFDF